MVMDPTIVARLERLLPGLLAKMREDIKEFPLRRDFVLENGPGQYAMATTWFAYYYNDFPELDGMVRILENLGLTRDVSHGNEKRFVITEELADYLFDSMVPPPSAGPGKSFARRRGFPADASDHMKVAKVISNMGADWTSHLKDVCLQLYTVDVTFPKKLRKAEGVDSWEELAEQIEEKGSSSARERVTKYIKYRIDWVRANHPTE
jgi:hypothetical protein